MGRNLSRCYTFAKTDEVVTGALARYSQNGQNHSFVRIVLMSHWFVLFAATDGGTSATEVQHR